MQSTDTLLTILVVILSILSIVLLGTIVAVVINIRRLSKQLRTLAEQSNDVLRSTRTSLAKTSGLIGVARMLWGIKKRVNRKK